jgi:ATP-dependent Clp protease ATP-binding subunit ClpB
MLAKNKIKIQIDDTVKDWLAARGYDPVYGARPLKRLIQTEVVNKLAKHILAREDEGPAEFVARIAKDGNHLEFAEVFDDVEAWAD